MSKNEGNVLFNDALNTFYLQVYGVGHMVKYHSESERKPTAATWVTLSDWETGKRYLRVYIHLRFRHARSRAQPLAWPVTLSVAGISD